MKFLLIISIVFSLFFTSCRKNEEVDQSDSSPSTIDLIVNLGGQNRAERFLGTFDEISKLTLDVVRKYGNKEVSKDFELLQNNSGNWIGTINNMIVDFEYEITGHAYKLNSDNSSYTEIFTGSTQHIVIEGTNTLSLRMAPILDNRIMTVPKITKVNRPFQMEKMDNASIRIFVSNQDLEPLHYRFRSIDENTLLPLNPELGGEFSPSSGIKSSSNGTYGAIETTYTSPNYLSKQTIQFRVSNTLNIGVSTSFDFYITGETESERQLIPIQLLHLLVVNESITIPSNGEFKLVMTILFQI